MVNIKNTVISILFIVVGAFLIRYALLRPCYVEPITQTIKGEIVEVSQPSQMNRLMCLSTDYMALIATLIGTACIFPGVAGLFKSLTEPSTDKNNKKKSKSKKKKKKK
ncbi:hypothetical protein GF378_02105 [Candidatus Pacearchaeota archaeon]|nr:hypothetical protein [Candidatus Pacearchaeota archaeon]